MGLYTLLAVYRFSLLGRGTFAFPDESIYTRGADALLRLRSGDVGGMIWEIAKSGGHPSSGGRPGWLVASMISSVLQVVPHAFGITPGNPWAMIVPTALNVVVSLITLSLFYRICLMVFDGERILALTAAAVYGTLVNTNLYLRHVLPYDWSLCIATYALWLALSRRTSPFRAAAIGVVAALAVLVYPGYYFLVVILGVVLLSPTADRSRASVRLLRGLSFACGGAAVLVMVIGVWRLAGADYVAQLRDLSGSVKQGAFDEGWIFVPRYLVRVEGYVGWLLLAGSGLFLVRFAWDAMRSRIRVVHWIALPAFLAWAWLAASSYNLHSMVLYGRLVHALLMFFVLASVDAIAWCRRASARSIVCLAVVVSAVISFVPSAYAYYRLAYPADVLYAFGVDAKLVPVGQRSCDLNPAFSYSSPPALNAATGYPYRADRNFWLVNFCYGAPSRRPSELTPASAAMTLLYRAPHFTTFPAYGFEGFTPDERRALSTAEYDVMLWQIARGTVK